jgi:SAM-dependent methyltransferase
MPNPSCTRSDYIERRTPEYFDDTSTLLNYQPDVYADTARIAASLGASRIVDVGCGAARKLVELAPHFQITGLDYGPNLEQARRLCPAGMWIETDLDVAGPLEVPARDLAESVVLCSDVIEHVRDPAVLVGKLRDALSTARALVISTPERELTRTRLHSGPPDNPAHTREWSVRELSAFLRRCGLVHGSVGLTRSHDQSLSLQTILAVYASNEQDLTVIEDVLIDAPTPSDYALSHRLKADPKAVAAGALLSWTRIREHIHAEIRG